MSTTLRTGTILNRRYKIIKLLGQGDFGKVYQAYDLRVKPVGKLVALKEMPMQMIVDCERQAGLVTKLTHRSIPRIFGYFATIDHSYLVKQYIPGDNLETVLNQEPGFLPEHRVIGWALQLTDILDYLHTHPLHPVVFRDLKPNNIMIDGNEQLFLVDFELARVFPPGFFEHTLPQFKHLRKGLSIGTAGYSPPEQYRGVVRPQSDIYALGSTLHHLLTKRNPRNEPPFTFQEHPVRSINKSVSTELDAIVMKALQRNVRDRFATARDMHYALEKLP
jgi:serine/threonine protein kinase